MPSDGEYQLEVFRSTADVSQHSRASIIALLNEITSANWQQDLPWWSASTVPFRGDHGIVFVHHRDGVVAFSCWRRLTVNNLPSICRSGIQVRPEHQGRGLFGLILRGIMDSEWASMPRADRVYYSWRTRNPINWLAHARACKTVAPSLHEPGEEASLRNIAVEIAKELHPDHTLELPDMIIRNSYPNSRYRKQPIHNTNSAIMETFRRLVPKPEDAIFSVGIMERKAEDSQ
jgi:hypothetical protein